MAEVESSKHINRQKKPSFIHLKALSEIKPYATGRAKGHGKIVTFNDCKEVFSRIFHINGREAWDLLYELQEVGLGKISPYKGFYVGGIQYGRNRIG